MIEIFHEGGFAMFPTSIAGVLLLVVAGLQALKPERRLGPLLRSLGGLTLGFGLLGLCLGLELSFRYIQQVPKADQLQILATGCAESLYNAILAFALVVLALLLATVGALRGLRRTGGA